jgi:hypothetical protein
VASYLSLPILESLEPAPSLSSLNSTQPSGLVGEVTGAASVPLAAEPPQGPSTLADPSGTDGQDPPGFVQTSLSSSSAGK